MNRPQDFALLLACGLPVACASTVDDDGTSGAHQDDVDEALAVCGPFAEKWSTCYAEQRGESGDPGYDYYLVLVGYCFTYFGYSTEPACHAAIEDFYACIAALSCSEIVGDDDSASDDTGGSEGESGADMPGPCEAEDERREMECDVFSEE
jgi:hypothetical protein